jgi:stearoyl-CoA desaturase (Delta-9 desaturase)
VFTFLTGMSITVGYHRLFAHKAFKAHPTLQLLAIFFGAGAFQESTLQWCSQHRQHHKYVDTDQDPYNIKQGFWYAHLGWLLFRRHNIDYSNVADLKANKVIDHQHEHYRLWGIVSGIALPILIGGLFGHWLGGAIFGVCARLTFVHHGTFMINSVCHFVGKATYDRESSPKDHWLVALITYGEGYHSFHHRFPSDYRNGVKWYHFDPSKWFIAGMSFLGATWDLKRATQFQIISAHLVAERDSVNRSITTLSQRARLIADEALKARYEGIKQLLHAWEFRVKEYGELRKQGLKKSDELRQLAAKRVQEARQNFRATQAQWARFIAQPPIQLAFAS